MFFISPPFGNYLNFKNTISIKGSFTLQPRSGLILRILKTLRYNFKEKGWVNKIGLRNKGIDYAVQKYKNCKNVIISVAILEHHEIDKLNNKIPSNMNLELNVSCPNVSIEELEAINRDLYKFLNKEREWCIVKLSPNVDNKLIESYYQQGFRQFHCSNTIALKDGSGGLSGPALKKYNSKIIPYIKKNYQKTTVIAGGGIKNLKDVQYYKRLGADHYSISSALFNPLSIFSNFS